MATKPVPLRLPEEVVDEVDKIRGDVSRTRWILRAIEARLASEKKNQTANERGGRK